MRKGDLPSSAVFKAFMRRIRTELYTRYKPDDNDNTIAPVQIPMGLVLITATLCGHAIHPGNPCREVEVCPVCIMRQCKASLERISNVWHLLGGPDERPEDLETQWMYCTMKKIWHVEKNRWASLVAKYEDFVQLEQEWEEQWKMHEQETLEVLWNVRSCAIALDVAQQTPFLTEGWNEEFVNMARGINAKTNLPRSPEPWMCGGAELPLSPPWSPIVVEKKDSLHSATPEEEEGETTGWTHPLEAQGDIRVDDPNPNTTSTSDVSLSTHISSPHSLGSSQSSIYAPPPHPTPSPPPPRKRVTFASDTPNYILRTRQAFCRSSSNYTPGRYACQPGSSWVDTSFANDGTFWLFGPCDEDENVDVEMEDVLDAEWERDMKIPVEGVDVNSGTEDEAVVGEVKTKGEETIRCDVFTQVPMEDSGTAEDEFEDEELEEGMVEFAAEQSKGAAQTSSQSQSQSEAPVKGGKSSSRIDGLGELVVQGSSRRRSRDEFEEGGITTEERATKRRKL
jgi:hypothetical protein